MPAFPVCCRYDEFLRGYGVRATPFTDVVFRVYDEPGKQSITFAEYILLVISYGSMSRPELIRFAFNCFDVRGRGKILEDEFLGMCSALHDANPSFAGNFKQALQEFDANDDGQIDVDEFTELVAHHCMIMDPVFQLQIDIQDNSLGHKRWLALLEGLQLRRSVQHNLSKYNRFPTLRPELAWQVATPLYTLATPLASASTAQRQLLRGNSTRPAQPLTGLAAPCRR